MSRNTQFYSQADHSVIIAAADGSFSHRVQDFADGDCIGWEPLAARVGATEGFDATRISFSSATGGRIILRLKPTSPSIGFLTRLFNLNRTQPQLINCTIYSGVKEIHSLSRGGVDKARNDTGAAVMAMREFTVTGENLTEDESIN